MSQIPEEPSEYIVSVETTQVTVENLSSYLETVGTLKAGDTAMVAAKINGRVTFMGAQMGDSVTQGQVLVTLDAVDAENSLAEVEARFAIAETNIESATQLVLEAEEAFQRSLILYESNAISQADHDRAEHTLTNARLGLKVSEGQLRQAEVALSTSRDALTNYSVTAPISGEVAAVNISTGEMANAHMGLLYIINLNPMKVSVNVSENIIGYIHQGAAIPLTITALNREITGIISAISPTIDNISKSFPVEILIDNPGDMKAGMVVKMHLLSGEAHNVLALPSEAILDKHGMKHVYVLDGENAHEVAVETGFMSDSMTTITSGLYAGQRVITTGNQLIRDGQKVSLPPWTATTWKDSTDEDS
jgi:RND family efflux transporter MFP subunit